MIAEKNTMKISIATWNMDSWKRNQEQRKAAWRYLTETISPDIALLQECVPPAKTDEDSKIIYQKIGGKRNWGSAVVTQEFPIQELEIKSSYLGALLGAEVTLPDESLISVISLYGLIDEDGYATTTLHRMLSDLTPLLHGRMGKRLFIMGGDYNVSTQWDEKYKNRDPSHRIFFERLEDFGLVNCTYKYFQSHVQTNRHPRSKTPWQNDYIHASKKISDRLVSCEVIDDSEIYEYSDHNPVIAIFDL